MREHPCKPDCDRSPECPHRIERQPYSATVACRPNQLADSHGKSGRQPNARGNANRRSDGLSWKRPNSHHHLSADCSRNRGICPRRRHGHTPAGLVR